MSGEHAFYISSYFLNVAIVSVPPHLKGDGMYDITLKKGRPIRYDLWFGGEPAPNVEWLREGRTLGPDENTSIELYSKNTIYTERNTVLSIPKVNFRERCFPQLEVL